MTKEKLLAPIALFVYNRPEHTRLTINALLANSEATESTIYIFSDGPKEASDTDDVSQVRKYAKQITGFANVNIIEHDKNLGLAESVIQGVTRLCSDYGRVIVLEDDLVTSPYFLKFMNDALNIYRDSEEVGAISGYMYPICLNTENDTVFVNYPMSWGWATWQRAWKNFNPDGKKLISDLEQSQQIKSFDKLASGGLVKMLRKQITGKNNSWFIRWCASNFLKKKVSLAPTKSLVSNIGIDGSGTHCSSWLFNPFDVEPSQAPLQVEMKAVVVDEQSLKKIKRFFIKANFLRYINALYRIFVTRLLRNGNE